MYPPGQEFVTKEGLGLPVESDWLPLVVGPAHLGVPGQLYRFYGGASEVTETVGRGSGAELAAAVAAAGGCLFLCTATSTAGALGAVAVARKSTSTGTITWSGTPNDAYRLRVKIEANNRFKYALDGFSNTEAYGWSPSYVIPSGGTFALPQTGTTIAFVSGAGPITFEAGDIHRADCSGPHYTVSDLSTAFATLVQQLGSLRIRRVAFAGVNATASSAVVLAAAAAGHLDTLATKFHFAGAAIDGGTLDTIANFRTARASFSDDRLGLVYDPQTSVNGCHIVSRAPFTGWVAPRVSPVNAIAERMASTQLSESLDRVISGSLRGVMSIGNDEGSNPLFTEEDRVITLRKQDGYAGFFITKGFIASGPTSDFRTLQWRFVMDEKCTVIHDTLGQWMGVNLRAKTDGTGQMLEEDAVRVEMSVRLKLASALKEPINVDGFQGHVSDCNYSVSRTADYLATGIIYGSGVAVPLRECDGAITTVGFARSL